MENVTQKLVISLLKSKLLIQLLDTILVNVLFIIPILMTNVLDVLIIVDIVKMRLAVLSVTLEWLWNLMNLDKDIVCKLNVQLVIIPCIGIISQLQLKRLCQVFKPRLRLMRISLTLLRKIVLNIMVNVIDVLLVVLIVQMDGLLVIKLVFVV